MVSPSVSPSVDRAARGTQHGQRIASVHQYDKQQACPEVVEAAHAEYAVLRAGRRRPSPSSPYPLAALS